MDSLKLTLGQFFRYVYGGTLSFFIGAVINPGFIKPIVEALGPVLTPLTAVAVGIAVYVFYRFIVGGRIDNFHLGRHPKEQCVFNYLYRDRNVEEQNRIVAFRIIRDSKFLKEHVRDILEIRHAEIHIAYLTFTICSVSSIYLFISGVSKLIFLRSIPFGEISLFCLFLAVSLFSIIFGYEADLQLCREEHFWIKIIYEEHPDDIKKLLQDMLLIQN